MIPTTNPNHVAWIKEDRRQRPLCDVPWLGTVAVLSDGNVNFCCYSSAIVGNVNQNTFAEIWNGPLMVGIRKELIARRLPPQCQSTSCPVYRGDNRDKHFSFVEEPHSFAVTGTHDPHAALRQRLTGSGLRLQKGAGLSGCSAPILEFFYTGQTTLADLFVCVERPDGLIRFLPGCEEYALPFLSGVEFSEDRSPMCFPLLDWLADPLPSTGSYRVCSALFECGSNPNLLSNCYWSEIKTLVVSKEGNWSI